MAMSVLAAGAFDESGRDSAHLADTFIARLRDLVPALRVDIAHQLTLRCPMRDDIADVVGEGFVEQVLFTFLLATVFCAMLGRHGAPCPTPADLASAVPELEPALWYQPGLALVEPLSRVLDLAANLPTPITLAGEIYQRSLDPVARRRFGAYYTPIGVVNHLLDQAGYLMDSPLAGRPILDVATGFGVFLAQAARRLVHHLRGAGMGSADTLTVLGDHLHGADLQPSAVVATKLHILATVIEALDLRGEAVAWALRTLKLPGIQVGDTLADSFDPPSGSRPFFVVGNPPYGVRPPHAYRERFGPVLYGRANLYQLFLYSALRRVAPGGIVGLLVPESLRSGKSFAPLRALLTAEMQVIATTDFHARETLFADVEQGVLILVVRKGSEVGPGSCRMVEDATVQVVQAADERSLVSACGFSVPLAHLQTGPTASNLLLKADSRAAYALLHRLFALVGAPEHVTLSVHTGRLVWNRKKASLHDGTTEAGVPVVYAPCIGRYCFSFPPHRNRGDRAALLYALGDAHVRPLDKPCVLIQRVTAREQWRRLVATLPTDAFLQRHPSYHVENHVNYVDGAYLGGQPISLAHVLGLLNSRLLNYLFSAMSGITQISVWELSLLPLLHRSDLDLSNMVRRRMNAQGKIAERLERQIDHRVYQLYGLSLAERDLVEVFHHFSHTASGRRVARED